MDLRNQRSENKKGAIFRTPKELQYWSWNFDKSGYQIDKNKYKKMLEQIRQEGGVWAKKTDAAMREFLDIQNKAVAAKKLKNITYVLEIVMGRINDAVRKSLPSSYYDDKEKAKAFESLESSLMSLRKRAKEEGIL